MMKTGLIASYLTRFPLTAAVCYVAVVIVFLLITASSIFDVLEQRQAVAAAGDTLSRLQRPSVARVAGENGSPLPTGSPIIEGQTVTVAGATLLQRVAEVVTRVGGNISSSEVDLQEAQSKGGLIKVSVDCEIDQPSLQELLYDIEAGMPFLFVDQLVAQAPEATAGASRGKLRVSILVSGKWQRVK